MEDFMTMQHYPHFPRIAMYLIDADTKEFIIGFYTRNQPIPQSGDIIQVDDDVYEVDKRIFEVKRDIDKKTSDVRFSLLVRKK